MMFVWENMIPNRENLSRFSPARDGLLLLAGTAALLAAGIWIINRSYYWESLKKLENCGTAKQTAALLPELPDSLKETGERKTAELLMQGKNFQEALPLLEKLSLQGSTPSIRIRAASDRIMCLVFLKRHEEAVFFLQLLLKEELQEYQRFNAQFLLGVEQLQCRKISQGLDSLNILLHFPQSTDSRCENIRFRALQIRKQFIK